MQLTESEKKALEQARKLEARWPKTRWIAVAFSLGIVAIAIDNIAIRSTFSLAGTVLLGLGFAQWIVIIRMWNGRPTLKLLIKLAIRNEENSN
jgi:uncharacterized membrane protein